MFKLENGSGLEGENDPGCTYRELPMSCWGLLKIPYFQCLGSGVWGFGFREGTL